jgi:hypothetical protein
MIDLLVVIVVVVVLIGIFLPSLGRTHCGNRQLKDSTQISGILMGMNTWAASSKDSYPLPSQVDLSDATVKEGQVATPEFGAKKDISRHIMSLLIFNGFIVPEMLISPAEANQQIRPFEQYEFTAPSQAEGDPAKALWDPAFAATPADECRFGRQPGDKAGFSFAHIPPYGKQKARWTALSASRFNSAAPVLGNRGPVYSGSAASGWKVLPGSRYGRYSNSNLIHGSRNTWEGNLAFSDGHTEYLTSPDPPAVSFSFSGLPVGKRVRGDCIFANEDDQSGVQLPGNPPVITDNAAPNSGGTYSDPHVGDMTTAYLRPVATAAWVNKKVTMTAFVD